MNLKEKRVLITGASAGIGRSIAISCAKKGAVILIHYRKNRKGAEQTLKEIEKYTTGYMFEGDLTDQEHNEKLFTSISHTVGDIDILVNNAGDAMPSNFFDNKAWRHQFENVFFSALYASQFFLRQNKKSALRKILNITSIYGNASGGNANYFAYSVAKAALSSMTVVLAKENGKILVNAIAPGYTWTPSWEDISEAHKKSFESRAMIQRYVTADEIALAAVGILENDAITGQVITVDGGLGIRTTN